ncbi:MAG: class I SAM-dependent methyltransferase [Pseudomonadales bacterium]
MYNFNQHWDENWQSETSLAKKKVAKEFLRPVFNYLNHASHPLHILDAGCGDGVHAEVLSEYSSTHRFIGVDISVPALARAQEKNLSNWKFEIADLSKLPYGDDTYDISFSFGVLGYTDNPAQSFRELCRVTKKGGLIGLWVCPRRRDLLGLVFSGVRKICSALGPDATKRIADCIVPFLGALPTRSKISLRNSTWKQCREIVLVNIAPPTLYFFKPSEIENWFAKSSVDTIEKSYSAPITVWGIKC